VRQFEQEGVRATIEVQSAARKVIEENTYLRELLSALGIDRSTINDWITRRRSSNDTNGSGEIDCHTRATRDSICNKTKEIDFSSSPSSERICSQPYNTDCRTYSSHPNNSTINSAVQSSATPGGSLVPDRSSPPRWSKSSSDRIQEDSLHDKGLLPKESSNPEEESSQPPSAPCRLLTRLAANPGSDVSQILAASDTERKADSAEGSLPCESAYKLLMRYATSKEKMEALARSLEDGCVPNSGGGCVVKNETVSQALLDICL
jgi:hypothetical protein